MGEHCDLKCPGYVTNADGDVSVCNGNGQCVLNDDATPKAICQCSETLFSGEACEVTCPNTFMRDEALVECNGHGSCENNACSCDMGYYAQGCYKSCPGLVEDASGTVECNGNGLCNVTTFKCECNEGDFVPETCECHSIA